MGKRKRAVLSLSCFLLALGVSAWTPLSAFGQSLGGDLVVKVTEGIAETPLEQVKVDLVRFPDEVVQSAFSDSTGRSEFHGVDPGSYSVRVSKPDYVSAEAGADVASEGMSNQVEVRMSPSRIAAPRGVAATVSAHVLSIPARAEKEFRKGFKALKEKNDPQRAVRDFEAALQDYPDYYEAHFLMGMAYLRMKSISEAQGEFERAVEMEPKFVEPYYPLAALLISEKQFDQAERLLTRGMQLDAQNWQFPFELAKENAERGRWDQALDYGRTAHARPSAPSQVHLLMADLYSNTGQAADAVRELQEFEKIDPQSPYMPRVTQALRRLQESR